MPSDIQKVYMGSQHWERQEGSQKRKGVGKHLRVERKATSSAREAVKKHRKSIGVGGRALVSAITVAKKHYKEDTEARRTLQKMKKGPEKKLPAVGCMVSYYDTTGRRWREGRLEEVRQCNDPQQLTAGWLCFKRPRRERERDRRLGAWIVSAVECTK